MSEFDDLAILSYLWKNPDEYEILHPLFKKAEFAFENKSVQLIYQCFSRSWEKANRFPTLSQAKEQISYIRNLKAEVKAVIYGVLDDLNVETYDEMTKDTILGRIMEPQRDALAELLADLSPWNFKPTADKVRGMLDDLEILTHKDIGVIFDPFDEKSDDISAALNVYLGATIPTGWPQTDEQLEGGFRRGELVMPAALPGDGKSMSCISLTCNLTRMLDKGYHVYYGIFDNTAQEVRAKMWANFLRIPTRRLDTEPTAPDRMRMFKNTYNPRGRITCRKWPRKTKTIADIKRDILLQQRRRGIKYSVAVLDYLDTIKPGNHHKENRHGLDEVTVGAAALAEELDMVVIAPTQLHRAAKFIEVPDIDNLAEAFSKSWHAAVIYMILATRMERINGECRFWWPKTRRNAEKWMKKMKRTNLYQDFTETEDAPYVIDENDQEVHEHAQESKRKQKARERAEAARPKIDVSTFEVGRQNSPVGV